MADVEARGRAEDDPYALARSLIAALDEIRNTLPPPSGGVGDRIRRHLDTDPRQLPGVIDRFPISERVNLQLALDELEAERAEWELVGIQADVGNFGGFSMTALAGGRFGMHVGEQPPEYAQLPIGVDEYLDCFRAGVVLTEHDDVPIGVLVFASDRGMQSELVVEVVGAADGAAAGFLSVLKQLMREKNVYRHKVVSFSFGHHGEFGLQFARVPALERSDVIMPEHDLAAIEDHTMTMSRHASQLRDAGQHLRRGLLLYGPPGTGKTHTVMYLCNQLEERTVFLLAGPAVQAIGQAGTLARDLQPSMIVIEDVDLIGMDRSLPGGEHNPLLFQLLNEMDGIGDDADVIFVLTTNRVDLLEPALAARPGRVDRAVEIALPDADARRRLLELYLPDGIDGLDADVVDRVVEQTAGAAAAFVKELARRCVLSGISHGDGPAEALPRALDEMLEHAPPVLRRSLGVSTTE